MTVLCLGYRQGFEHSADRYGLSIHFVVEKEKQGLQGRSFTKVESLADPEEVLRALAPVLNSIDAVVTGHEQALFTAALIRNLLGLTGDGNVLNTSRFRDKQIQKNLLPPHIPHAKSTYVSRAATTYPALSESFGERLVLKPTDGHGARGTTLIRDQSDWDAYFAEHPIESNIQVVAESFIEGEEIHVDGVWENGQLKWGAVTPYLGHLMDWECGAVIGDVPLGACRPQLRSEALRLTTDVLESLAAPTTVFHLEAYVSNTGELTFGEVAARNAGGLTTEIVALTYGVDLYDAALEIARGIAPRIEPVKDPEILYGYAYLPWNSSMSLSRQDFTSRFQTVECVYPEAEAGHVGAYGNWGHVVVSARTHEELKSRIDEIVRYGRHG